MEDFCGISIHLNFYMYIIWLSKIYEMSMYIVYTLKLSSVTILQNSDNSEYFLLLILPLLSPFY